MTNTDLTALAAAIRERYTPLALKCGCGGAHDDCRTAMDSAAVWAQNDTVVRIAKFIENYK